MSWHYSAVLVEEFSERGLLVTASSVRLRTNRMLSRSCFDGRRTGRSTPSQSGTTSKPSTDFLFVGSMWSVPDSPANPSVQQDSNEEKMTTATSGLIQRECLGRYEAESCCLRTLQDCFGCTEELSSVTLPAWGMIVGGELYPLKKPEPLTSENGGGAWLTPRASDVAQGENQETFLARMNDRTDSCAQSLAAQVRDEKTWPTPTVGDSKSSGSFDYKETSTHNPGMTLCDATERGFRYPTPTATERSGTNPNTGRGAGLWKVVQDNKWPTPIASQAKGGAGSIRKDTGKRREDRLDHLLEPGQQGKLSPDWTEWLMGWPCGWTSLDPLPEGTMEAWETSVKAGTYWDTDPADTGEVPRLTEKKENRVSRLKAIGNGQVPAQLVLALQCLGGEA